VLELLNCRKEIPSFANVTLALKWFIVSFFSVKFCAILTTYTGIEREVVLN